MERSIPLSIADIGFQIFTRGCKDVLIASPEAWIQKCRTWPLNERGLVEIYDGGFVSHKVLLICSATLIPSIWLWCSFSEVPWSFTSVWLAEGLDWSITMSVINVWIWSACDACLVQLVLYSLQGGFTQFLAVNLFWISLMTEKFIFEGIWTSVVILEFVLEAFQWCTDFSMWGSFVVKSLKPRGLTFQILFWRPFLWRFGGEILWSVFDDRIWAFHETACV